MKKSFILFFALFLFFSLFFANTAKAAERTFYATNIENSQCSLGSQITVLNSYTLDSSDLIIIKGTGFGITEDGLAGANACWGGQYQGGVFIKNGTKYDSISCFTFRIDNQPIGKSFISWNDSEIRFYAPNNISNNSYLDNDVVLRIYDTYHGNITNCKTADLRLSPICSSFTYSDWSTCSQNNTQTREILNSSPTGCSDGSPILAQSCTPICTNNDYSCNDWGSCSVNGSQTRTCTKISNCDGGVQTPTTSQGCIYVPPTCNSWTYSGWSDCQSSGMQTRTIDSSSPNGCVGGNSVLTQSCTYPPLCTSSDWSCATWSICSSNGTQTRTCNKISNCQSGTSFPETSRSCTFQCTEDTWECGDWGTCSSYGTQRRSCNRTYNCPGVYTPSPAISQSCTPACTEDIWSCGNWSTCSVNGRQSRSCTKTYDCPSAYTSSPPTTQYCNYEPQCTSDTWSCGSWGLCSPSGIQTRNCNKTYDCPSAETASPATSQYCEAPNRPQYQTPSDDSEITNQSSIIKATVKLICPVSRTMASQGSGTIINSDGTILTNKHVVNGTAGCLVGFIDNYNNEPYFADRHIAEIDSISSNADIAILKLRNPYKRKLTSINITGSNSNNLSLGNRITTYGYPAKFGTKITYTSGDFSGVDGNYLKTTAVIEYGNSGGGAYLKNGTFIGIPTAVMKGELNSLGYILSVNKINSWLNNSPMAYNYNDNNSYARVSILEDIDLSTLDSLDLFIFEENQNTESNQQQNNNSSNGSLVRAKSTAGIYLIESGNKRPIKSAKIFLAKGYKWGDVTEVSQAEMNNYPLGTDLTIDEDNENKETPSKQESAGTLSNGALVRVKGTHGVYLIHNNQKRPIKSATIFLGRGYKWGDVVDVEQSVLNTYPLGENVALSESITTENETQTITINVPRLRTRSLPSLDGKIITLVLEGDSYDVISEQNGWYKINYESGKTGWVMSMYTK